MTDGMTPFPSVGTSDRSFTRISYCSEFVVTNVSLYKVIESDYGIWSPKFIPFILALCLCGRYSSTLPSRISNSVRGKVVTAQLRQTD
jgi:hypothetical protein